MIVIIFLILFLHPYVFYPLTLLILNCFKKNQFVPREKSTSEIDVTLIIVAHNEEKVIQKKILNALNLDYDQRLLKIIVASDCSTDKTNDIVLKYADKGIKLVKTSKRLGRANAHNEALKFASSSIIAYSDANTMWKEDALSNLVENFKNPKIGYVTGKLVYTNTSETNSSSSEGLYWKIELLLRQLESNLDSITAGNGAIYAIRKECAKEIDILYSHDISYPAEVVKRGYKSKYDSTAIAEEKAGVTSKEEFQRKVRMFGRAFYFLANNLWTLNPYKVGLLYSYFFLSHRFLRYFGGFNLLCFILTFLFYYGNVFSLKIWLTFFGTIIIIFKTTKMFYNFYYFLLFQVATLLGLWNYLTGKIKPFWISPKSTREI